MSITETKEFLYTVYGKDYSREVILKYAAQFWDEHGRINSFGFKNDVKKTSAGYDVLMGFVLWLCENVKPRRKRKWK